MLAEVFEFRLYAVSPQVGESPLESLFVSLGSGHVACHVLLGTFQHVGLSFGLAQLGDEERILKETFRFLCD